MLFGAALARLRRMAARFRQVFPHFADGRLVAMSAILALFVLLHVIWFIRVPDDLDAFNFVLALRQFDVTQHRPHPPGAPVFVALGKASAWVWQSLGMPADSLAGHEPASLTALSLIAGTLTIVLTWSIMRLLDCPPTRTLCATLLVASAPLMWIAAARRLSDAVGLAVVLASWALMVRGKLSAAAALAGLAMGLRVQTALLTIPPLVLVVMHHRRWKPVVTTSGWFVLMCAAWLVPLVADTGGPERYWAALTRQAADDMTSPVMLAARPTLRNVSDALFNTFIRPWGAAAAAIPVVAAALAGLVRLQRIAPRRAAILLLCASPYVLFHIAFHETATVRYALPIVLIVAYLAAVALEGIPRRWRIAVAVLVIGTNLLVSVRALEAYSRGDSPAMALLKAMYRRAADHSPAFVTGHGQAMLPRLQEIVTQPVPWRLVPPSDDYHEWRIAADFWRDGGTAPLWFVADPRRTSLSLIDRRSRQVLGSFRLHDRAAWALNGTRPEALTWWELRQPAWVAVKGFALTPEVGGIAARDGEGPSSSGAVALLRRFDTGSVLVVGGRHMGRVSDPPVRIAIEIDGREVHSVRASAQERQYVALVHLSSSQLRGDGPYATLTIRSTAVTQTDSPVPVTVEQFDYQRSDGTLFAFGSGWHEPEIEAETGETWRWAARRATPLLHRPAGADVALNLAGGAPRPRFRLRRSASPHIDVTSGERLLDRFPGPVRFSRQITVPAGVSAGCDVEITVTSTTSFVPKNARQSADARDLAFLAYDLEVVPIRIPATSVKNGSR